MYKKPLLEYLSICIRQGEHLHLVVIHPLLQLENVVDCRPTVAVHRIGRTGLVAGRASGILQIIYCQKQYTFLIDTRYNKMRLANFET